MYQTLCEGAIRILTLPSRSNKGPIRCTLENQSIELASVSEYSALSYTWGLPSQPKKEIIINGREFKVFANLFSALTHLRLQQEPRKLWIDAICINQTDTEEKKTQIPLMRYIYAQAKTVEIWLGPDEDDGEFVLRSIERKDFAVLETLKFMQAYTALVQRPWFSRTWIIQEFILA
ncbi:heterokaryon incompatibility protein-domain-containing protein, partial [Tricladium varicosporioides]